MIQRLLWRCPICHTNDSLVQVRKIFRPTNVHCNQCKTTWQVRRVVGEDYWLKVLSSDSNPDEVGVDLPLADWYARLKDTMALAPIDNPGISLENGEVLYLKSKRVAFHALTNDPRFSAYEDATGDGDEIGRLKVGEGRLFLTSQRLIWQNDDGDQQDFSLEKINSFYTAFNFIGVIMVEKWLYQVSFLEDSLLKWVTYFDYISKEVLSSSGHFITTSNY